MSENMGDTLKDVEAAQMTRKIAKDTYLCPLSWEASSSGICVIKSISSATLSWSKLWNRLRARKLTSWEASGYPTCIPLGFLSHLARPLWWLTHPGSPIVCLTWTVSLCPRPSYYQGMIRNIYNKLRPGCKAYPLNILNLQYVILINNYWLSSFC